MNKIKQLRQEKGITQKELGDILSVQKAAISKYELGRATPSTDVLKKMATYFNVSLDELLDYTPATPPASPTATDQRAPSLTPDEQALLSSYRQLNANDKQDVQDYIEYRRSKSPVKDDKAI